MNKPIEQMTVEELRASSSRTGGSWDLYVPKEAFDELARRLAERDKPYPEDHGKTHYEGCWKERGHHNCAVARIAELEREIERMKPVVEAAIKWRHLGQIRDLPKGETNLAALALLDGRVRQYEEGK